MTSDYAIARRRIFRRHPQQEAEKQLEVLCTVMRFLHPPVTVPPRIRRNKMCGGSVSRGLQKADDTLVM